MIGITIAVAVVASVIVWLSRPITALVVYLAVTCLYPQYLAVSIGTADFSTSRILVLVILLRIFTRRLDPDLMRIRWTDVLVLLFFGCSVLSSLTNEPPSKVIEREGGIFFDTVLAYAIARFTLRTREDVYTLMRGLIIVGLPLAVIGINQSITSFNPYGWMREYSPFHLKEQEMRLRHGLYRADASFGNKIPFGLLFAMLIPLNAALFFAKQQGFVKFAVRTGILLIGLISAMSSAPMFAIVTATAFMASFPIRRMWPYLVFVVVTFCMVIEMASDRHFYHVLTRFALNSSTAYYRIELMEEALGGGMNGHWIFGFGYLSLLQSDVGHNGFNWQHVDIVNIYIYHLATVGLVGLIPFIWLNIHYYWCLYRAAKTALYVEDRWAIWCLSAGIVGWNVAMMTVGALAQTNSLMYVLIALASASRYVFASEPEYQEEEGGVAEPSYMSAGAPAQSLLRR